MNETAARLQGRLTARSARVGVVGLGYVGLPLAVEFAGAGFVTTGIDLDGRKVDAVNQGTSYIPDVSTDALNRHRKPINGSRVTLSARAWRGAFDVHTEALTPEAIGPAIEAQDFVPAEPAPAA